MHVHAPLPLVLPEGSGGLARHLSSHVACSHRPLTVAPACCMLLLSSGRPRAGILVLSAREGGPAWKAGIQGTSRDEFGRLVSPACLPACLPACVLLLRQAPRPCWGCLVKPSTRDAPGPLLLEQARC